MKNVKLPLTYGEGSDREWYIHDADGNWIAEAVPATPGVAEEVARRIVACCNALKNVSTEWLEAQSGIVCLGSPIKDRFLEIEQQRDELLAALILASCCLEPNTSDATVRQIEAAIANAKEN